MTERKAKAKAGSSPTAQNDKSEAGMSGLKPDLSALELKGGSRYTDQSAQGAGESLCSGASLTVSSGIVKKEKNNAQVEDPFGRGQALQEDRHRQDQAGPHEDAAHPFVKVAEAEAEARKERNRF
jgi:hypothetical protein